MRLSVIVILALLCAACVKQESPMELPKYVAGVTTTVEDAEALFKDEDPKLNRNKQAAYRIWKELIEAGHWENADQLLTERYLQHNPLAQSGRAEVVKFFTGRPGYAPKPIPEKVQTKFVAVIAQGDYVTTMTPRHYQDPKDPTKSYWTTWFDTWRFVDGKADEHWDSQTMDFPKAAQ